MKYWEFDVCAMIADYEKNKRTLASIDEALIVARGYLKNPMGEDARGETERYIELLELKEREYRMYVDMVILGLGELPEIERNVLKWWLIERYPDEGILRYSGIENEKELQKIKQLAVKRFHGVIMPN